MSQLNEHLLASLQTGFIDHLVHSKGVYLPQLLVNDKKAGVKVLSTIQKELQQCHEFWFSVAFVTNSGVAALMQTLIELEEKKVKGNMLVSQYLNFTQPEALRRLSKFSNITLKIATEGDFHSKGYLFKFKDQELYNLIVGSSNLTQSALSSNKELNMKVTATPESLLIHNAKKAFSEEFEQATPVSKDFIDQYEVVYKSQKAQNRSLRMELDHTTSKVVKPNSMQVEAMANIAKLRKEGKNKALLISATGTGKTYFSAFDAKAFDPKKLLFVVHRENIAKKAKETFDSVFGASKQMGMYSGQARELEKDFIFSTIQTISRPEHLERFSSDHFDYIIIDETHRAGADSYQRILDHFKPKFLLGMTATPERTDGLDVFKLFDHNIAYEIRLHRALDEDMLSPFHYYGITDLTVDDKVIEEESSFNLLTADERIDRIIEKSKLYSCDSGEVRGLIFCSSVEECETLSQAFNDRGYRTVSLTGGSSEEMRAEAIQRLESDDTNIKLDYIFSRDVFNEGIDIPRVNQVIMLRPTQSAIVFVQQLGRGLRKTDGKEYLTVIDFIGNYKQNYLVPIALYGDTSFNKDTLRKLMVSGSSLIPGASTINFDQISRDRIFKAIDAANMQQKRDLVNDYRLLKYKLGKVPMMVDYLEHGSRDPYLYADYSDSYYNFVQDQEDAYRGKLNTHQIKLLELFSKEINNSKRVEESLILDMLMQKQTIEVQDLIKLIQDKYQYTVNDTTIESAIHNLNFAFVTENKGKKLIPVKDVYAIKVLNRTGNIIAFDEDFAKNLLNDTFFQFLKDNVQYAIKTFDAHFNIEKYVGGFVLYCKYSRKDVFRILNWETNPVAQNVGGYIINQDKTNCPIFVNYHKAEDISSTTKYEDGFVNHSEFEWMSKSKRTLNSPDVITIRNYKNGLRLPLFIKKNNDEGTEFYYMGDVTPIDNSFEQTYMDNDKGKSVSVVKVRFTMNQPVEDSIYEYITNDF